MATTPGGVKAVSEDGTASNEGIQPNGTSSDKS